MYNTIMYAAREEQERASLLEVLCRMDRAGLLLNKMFAFNVKGLRFLGNVVSERGLELFQGNGKTIDNAPAGITRLRSLLSLVSYYSSVNSVNR